MEMRVKKQIKVTDERRTPGKTALTVLFAVISVIWMMPIVIVLYNSLKTNGAVNTELFALPNAQSYVGFDNYINDNFFRFTVIPTILKAVSDNEHFADLWLVFSPLHPNALLMQIKKENSTAQNCSKLPSSLSSCH